MNHVFTVYSFPGLQIIIIKRWHKRKVEFGNFLDRGSLFGAEKRKSPMKEKRKIRSRHKKLSWNI